MAEYSLDEREGMRAAAALVAASEDMEHVSAIWNNLSEAERTQTVGALIGAAAGMCAMFDIDFTARIEAVIAEDSQGD